MWESYKHSNLVFEVRLSCPPPFNTWTALWTSSESHSCWGPLFELTAGGLQHPLASSYPLSPTLPQTLQPVTIAWRGLLRGLKPPTAAARLVNGSMQADHLRAPGVDLLMCPAGLLHLLRITKEKVARTHETEQKGESNIIRNFQGDPFIIRLWTALFNRSGYTWCILKWHMKQE